MAGRKITLKNTKMKATINDFKIGTTLVDSESNEFTLYNKYADGIWESRSKSGHKCIFECEARFYTLKNK